VELHLKYCIPGGVIDMFRWKVNPKECTELIALEHYKYYPDDKPEYMFELWRGHVILDYETDESLPELKIIITSEHSLFRRIKVALSRIITGRAHNYCFTIDKKQYDLLSEYIYEGSNDLINCTCGDYHGLMLLHWRYEGDDLWDVRTYSRQYPLNIRIAQAWTFVLHGKAVLDAFLVDDTSISDF
jgi:hypothetical protein